MYLKRLEIKGFKSFADHTEIRLDPGINIIVGPNGCGKSNVVDAIRWVLGEANVRHLRGQRNEDIIFNGSDDKKALGMAMVEITVDNNDHVLPLDYSEVTLTRKYYRSGESEFLINRSRVRLKDIVQLFTGTGLGRQGYSIISQGELEEVLNGQPFDRRLMLEEASGVIKYRQQRDEVERRISVTAGDLVRVKDILGELNLRREELQVKSQKAVRCLELQERFQFIEKTLIASEWMQIRQQKIEKEGELNSISAVIQQNKEAREKFLRDLSQQEEQREGCRTQLLKLREQKYSLERDIQRLQSECQLGEERIKNLSERKQSSQADLEKYKGMLEQMEKELSHQNQDFNEQENEYRQMQADETSLKEEIIKLEEGVCEARKQFEADKLEAFDRVQGETAIKNQIIDQEKMIKLSSEKKERLSIRMEANREKIHQNKSQLSQLQGTGQQLTQGIKQAEAEQEKAMQHKNALSEKRQALEQLRTQRNRELISLENRLLGLQEMDKNYAGYSDGVKAIMQKSRGNRRIHGVMSQIIEVPPGLETAIETAAGRSLENVVAESSQDAQQAIDYLKKNQLGRVTFLPLDLIKTQKISDASLQKLKNYQGVMGLASSLVRYDSRYEKAVEYILGRVLIVDKMDTAIKVFKNVQAGLRIVTIEGELLNASGAMTGGVQKRRGVSPLQRKAEEKRLEENIRQAQEELAASSEKIEILDQNIEKAEKDLEQCKQVLMELSFQSEMLEQEMSKLTISLEQTAQDVDADQRDLNELDHLLQDGEEERQRLTVQYEECQKENLAFSEQMEELRSRIDASQHGHDLLDQRLRSLQEALERKERELQTLKANREQFEQLHRSYQKSIEETCRTLQDIEQDLGKQVTRLEEDRLLIKTRQEEQEVLLANIEEDQTKEKEVLGHIERLRRELEPLQQEILQGESQLHQQQMRLVRLETEIDNLQNRWEEKYTDEAAEKWEAVLTAGKVRDYKRELEYFRQQIEDLGAVDLQSIKDYEQVQERYDFLQQQSVDLEEARRSLEELLRETEKTMSKSFDQFMELANDSFRQTFMEIFGGGDAELKLQEDEDLFSAGVDIIVKMPGKKSQSLNLLSGGERALTCIAFIFALLRLRPAPFCLLDEIDAALDETNLTRFTHFIQKMAASTQFIVITHRQASIEAGEKIYGVTMPQDGISSILSLTLPEVNTIAG